MSAAGIEGPYTASNQISLTRFGIGDIKLGGIDQSGAEVRYVYSKVSSLYAVYKTQNGVFIQYSDDSMIAAGQRKRVVPLNRLRAETSSLISLAGSSRDEYETGLAAALVLCLEGDSELAAQNLLDLKNDIVGHMESVQRYYYIGTSLCASVLIAGLIAAFGRHASEAWASILASTQAGAVGAFFSIAISIRSRVIAVAPFLNLSEAALRTLIGAIAATTVAVVFQSGILPISIRAPADPGISNLPLFLLGFISGFFERLVPASLETQAVAFSSRRSGTSELKPLREELDVVRTGLRQDLAGVPQQVSRVVNDILDQAFSVPTPINYSGIAVVDVVDDLGKTFLEFQGPSENGDLSDLGAAAGQSTPIELWVKPGTTAHVQVAFAAGETRLGAQLASGARVAVEIQDGLDKPEVPLRLVLDPGFSDAQLQEREITIPAKGHWSAQVFSFRAPLEWLATAPDQGDVRFALAINQLGTPYARIYVPIRAAT